MARTKHSDPEDVESVDEAKPVETDFYKADPSLLIKLGLPYCETCGQQLQRGLYGEPICPITKPDCERNVKPKEVEPVTE